MTTRRLLVMGSLLVLPLCVLWAARLLLLGGAYPVGLQAADPLVGGISQALTSTGQMGLPVAGRDYRLQDTTYFDNKTWVAVSVKGTNNTITDGLFVL